MSSKLDDSHLLRVPDVVFEASNACALINESIARDQFAANLAPVWTGFTFVAKVGQNVDQELKVARVDRRWWGQLLRLQSIHRGLLQAMPKWKI